MILVLLNKVDLPLLKMATGEVTEVDNKDPEVNRELGLSKGRSEMSWESIRRRRSCSVQGSRMGEGELRSDS